MIDEPFSRQSIIEESDKIISEYKNKVRVLNLQRRSWLVMLQDHFNKMKKKGKKLILI